jgi:hypothetical protein
LLWRRSTLVGISMSSSAICAMLAINLLDNIPNASIGPLTWMLAGVVLLLSADTRRHRALRSKANHRRPGSAVEA